LQYLVASCNEMYFCSSGIINYSLKNIFLFLWKRKFDKMFKISKIHREDPIENRLNFLILIFGRFPGLLFFIRTIFSLIQSNITFSRFLLNVSVSVMNTDYIIFLF